MANTIIDLNDTPSSYSLSADKFLRVNSAGTGVQFWDIELGYLHDVQTDGAYQPSVGDTLLYSANGKWRPGTLDVYSAGNGLNKSGLTLNVEAGAGLTSDGTGVYITDIANVSGTHGNASYVPVLTVNSKGQITGVTETQIVAQAATTITDDFVGNINGTAGQIRVTGGTGNNSNATIDLVATGVTAAVYGNATHLPKITVDTYGRIQNVDMIEIAGGGNGNISGSSNVLNFQNIVVSGQTTVAADKINDTLTLAGTGAGVITTQANADTIFFGVNSAVVANEISIEDIVTGSTDGDLLQWSAANSAWEAQQVTSSLPDTGVAAGTYGSVSNVAQFTVDGKGRITNVTELSIPQGDITDVVAGNGLIGGGNTGNVTLELADSPVTAGTYGTATIIPQINVDKYGRVVGVVNVSVASHIQSLSWNASTNQLSIGGGNAVDLSSLTNTDAQLLTLTGNTLSISGGNSVDLSSFAGGGVGGGGTASNAFSTVSVVGESDVVATNEDTLTLVAGSGVSIATNASAQSVTISSTGVVNQGLDFGTFTNPVGFTLDMGTF